MTTKVSTTSRVLDIASLFDNQGSRESVTPKQALTGIFTNELVNTKDYIITLVTYVNCQEEGKPQDGAEYELELKSEDKIRTFSFIDELLTYVDAYVTNKHGVQRVEFSFEDLATTQYEIIRPTMNGRKSIKLTEVDVTISEIDDIDALRPVGFVKQDELTALAPLWDTIKGELK